MNNNVLKKEKEIKGTGTKSATVILDIIMVNPSTWLLLYLNTKIFCNITVVLETDRDRETEKTTATPRQHLYTKRSCNIREELETDRETEKTTATPRLHLYTQISCNIREVLETDRETEKTTATPRLLAEHTICG